MLLISNNPYRLRAIGGGTRPRLDDGRLGVAVFEGARPRGADRGEGRGPVRQWATPAFEVRSAQPVAGGVDGEAVMLEAPLRFTTRPGVLAVRIAPGHPGASPSAGLPDSPVAAAAKLVRIAAGRPG